MERGHRRSRRDALRAMAAGAARIAASVEHDTRDVPTTPPIHWDEEIDA
jgi:hypothetical protein